MKKFVSILLAMLMVLGLFAGCGQTDNNQADGDKDYSAMTIDELKPLITTITEGTLTMVTSPDFAPYEFYALDENGTPTLAGFDIALANYIADYIGLELEIIPMDFNGTITELGMKKADIGMAGYSPDPKREDAMDFSIFYYEGGQSFVTNSENAASFQSLADANNAQYQIGAQTASIQYDLAVENTPDADIVQLAKVTDIVNQVNSNKLAGAFIETVVAEAYAETYENLVIAFDVPYEAEGSVVGVYKGNEALLAAVNLAIQAALNDGSMAQFIADANELATGDKYEGVLDEEGQIPADAE